MAPAFFSRLDPSEVWLRRDGRVRIPCVVDLATAPSRQRASEHRKSPSWEASNSETPTVPTDVVSIFRFIWL